MRTLWKFLLIFSSILVIVNLNSGVSFDFNDVIYSMQELDFDTTYIQSFENASNDLASLDNSGNFFETTYNFFKSIWSLVVAFTQLLLNSFTNITKVLIWFFTFGFRV